MGFTTDQLEALEKAIASGVREVAFKDRVKKYSSTTEMLRLRDLMRRELGQVGTSQLHYPSTRKGLE